MKQEGFDKSVIIGDSYINKNTKQNVIIAESNGQVRKRQKKEIAIKKSVDLEPPLHHEKHLIPDLSNNRVNIYSFNKDMKLEKHVEKSILEIFSVILHIDEKEFDLETAYTDFGIDSILAIEVINRINKKLDINLRSTDLFNHANIKKLTDYIVNEFGEKIKHQYDPKLNDLDSVITRKQSEDEEKSINILKDTADNQRDFLRSETLSIRENKKDTSQCIAIIGISGRFPDAENVMKFWDNLQEGKNSVREIDRWDMDAFYDPVPQIPGKSYSKWGGFLSDVGMFDPLFFNISPKEAELMDPQQRLFLEEAWKAIEDAGYSSEELEGNKCGVFVGCAPGDYRRKMGEYNILPEAYSFMGNNEA
ncbi:acyl carrier protein, partial [Bacillus wiedmannii]|uniref:acyl carrier protein n=1 Tax=Bacillus wiedmannii TaxID=1890302 RepID=UPI00211D3420